MNGANPSLIAPCGINCRLCSFHQREKKPCPGCRGVFEPKAYDPTLKCQIKHCLHLTNNKMSFCTSCESFPCRLIRRLDKRYSTKYGTSPIQNLKSIQAIGLSAYVLSEDIKWTCPQCGAMLCMHHPHCLACDYAWNA